MSSSLILDTNIIVIYGRDNQISDYIEDKYKLFSSDNRLAVSVVTLGEINALVRKLEIGKSRMQRMESVIRKTTVTEINYTEVIEAYGMIDHFSSGKIQVQVNKKKFSSRNMGKKDLWIAATAKTFDLTLVTTDKDFIHLDGEIVDVLYIDLDEVKKLSKK